jgi:hypothetical protein
MDVADRFLRLAYEEFLCDAANFVAIRRETRFHRRRKFGIQPVGSSVDRLIAQASSESDEADA